MSVYNPGEGIPEREMSEIRAERDRLAARVKALEEALRDIAERQREACAQAIRPKPGESRAEVLTRIAFSQGVVRATALVTDSTEREVMDEE